MEQEQSQTEPSWLQKLWPLKRYELKKIVPLLFLKFFVSFCYAILTCMKDTLVVTADGAGAEVIPVLKGWIVLPIALLTALIYSKLSNIFKRSTLYYGTIGFFLAIVALYGFVLYPYADYLTPHKSADWLTELVGKNHSHWVSIYRYWMHSVFFVIAELWASVVIFLLFWGFANHITNVNEAKRTYTLFIAAGDVGTILTGPLVLFFIKKFGSDNFAPSLQSLLSIVIFFGICMMAIYAWMNRYVLTDPRFYNQEEAKHLIEDKTKLNLFQSIKHVLSSKYLLCIGILVVGCALTINMVEVTWKAHLKLQYPTAGEYQLFWSKVTTAIGTVALITVLFLGGTTIRIFGWHFSAQITPILVGISGLLFYVLCLFKDHLGPLAEFVGLTPLALIVLYGAFQNIMSKVAKYSFFDSTKEMAFIPLDQESKVKGKAAIDTVGSRFGKSGSAWVQVALIDLVGTGSVMSITSYLIPVVAISIVAWSLAVRYLNREFQETEAATGEKQAA